MALPLIQQPISTELEGALRARIGRIPCMQNLGMSIQAMGQGECILSMKHDPKTDGIFEAFHGGMLTTAADTVACFAIMTYFGPDQMLTTTDLNIRFLSACLSDVTAHAHVIKRGKTLCVVAVDLYDESQKLVAVAQVTYMLLEKLRR
jgi:acyl-CoA thioesterase